MKWETKDRLYKIGFAMMILATIAVIAFSYKKCQRGSVEEMFYGEPSKADCTLKNGCNNAK